MLITTLMLAGQFMHFLRYTILGYIMTFKYKLPSNIEYSRGK